MWVFTTIGFFSVVSKGKGQVQIRARRKEDLQNLIHRFSGRQRILATPTQDYPFRILVPTWTWRRWMAKLAEDVEQYTNFKSAVGYTDPERADIYARVWEICITIEGESSWPTRRFPLLGK